MSPGFNFAQLLRPVGQMLETFRVESFSLKLEADGLYVSAQKVEERQIPKQDLSLRVVWQAFRRSKPEPDPEPRPSSGLLELRYTDEDIARLDTEGRAKRKEPGRTPEAHALSQILRAVGGYVDQKGGRLLRVTKAKEDITIEYESALRKPMTERFTVASLYDFWVKMYLRRKQRS
jgi:hypothetical protein